jgi:hypothetical protein
MQLHVEQRWRREERRLGIGRYMKDSSRGMERKVGRGSGGEGEFIVLEGRHKTARVH